MFPLFDDYSMSGKQQSKEKKLKDSCILLFLMLLFFFLSGACTNSTHGENHPRIIDGYLDLSSWDSYTQTKFHLSGRWECYWGEFLEYKDFTGNTLPAQKSYLSVPGFWKGNTIRGKRLTDEGFCTYRLHIDLPQKPDKLGIRVKGIFSSYRLFVNDRLIIEMGKPGKTKET